MPNYNYIDITGQIYNRLEVISRAESKRLPCGKLTTQWLVRCTKCIDCEPFVVDGSSLKRGGIKSCKLCREELISESHSTHGNSQKPGWLNWHGMMRRCFVKEDDRYPRYGGRGITVCERWRDFNNFIEDMGSPPQLKGYSLDRINNEGIYEPGNVRWATAAEQARNRGSNVFITFQGKTQCLRDWARELNKPYSTLKNRRYRGWSDEDILLR